MALTLGQLGLLRAEQPPATGGTVPELRPVGHWRKEFLDHRAAGHQFAPGGSIRETLQHQPAIFQGNDALHPRRAQRPLIPALPDVGLVSASRGARHQQRKQEPYCPAQVRPFSRPDGLLDLLHVNVFQLAGLRIRRSIAARMSLDPIGQAHTTVSGDCALRCNASAARIDIN